MEKYEIPVPPGQSRSSRSKVPFDRTYLRPLFMKVSCPSCQKIYRIDSRDVEKAAPEFECLSCQVIFTFDAPVVNPNNIPTRVIGTKAHDSAGSKATAQAPAGATAAAAAEPAVVQDARPCPKCLALNPKGASECLKCGVIFAKLEGLPLDEQTGAIPSLVRGWKHLMSDYQNLRKHLEFMDRCEDLNAIPYALKKYEELKSVQPQDEIADNMLKKAIMRHFARIKPEKAGWYRQLREVPWRRVAKLAPLTIAGSFMLVGLIWPSLRNMVGIGAAIGFVTIGFTIFLKGRFNPRDLWE